MSTMMFKQKKKIFCDDGMNTSTNLYTKKMKRNKRLDELEKVFQEGKRISKKKPGLQYERCKWRECEF